MATQLHQWGVKDGIHKNDAGTHHRREVHGDRRVLLVEDVPGEAELTVRELRKSGMPFLWRRVESEIGLKRALQEFHPDLILSDFTLPQFDGLKALELARTLSPQTPFIFVSGSIGEERAIDALQKGACDYVLKTNLARLVPAVTRALDLAGGTDDEPSRATTFSIDTAPLAQRALEQRLSKALALGQFELNYQPQVCIHTRRILGVEALLRWRDPEAGLASPATFLPALESSGLIEEVGEWVLERAARDSRRWRRLGLPPVRTAVNVSAAQLRRPDFAHRFLKLTRPWASGIFSLDVDIDEATLLGDTVAELKKLKLLRSAGIRIAIDDFGSGLSSLGRLSGLPIDILKIDRTFVSGLPHDPAAKAVVSMIMSLARGLRLSVVAEGVETKEQLETLRQMGCDQSQGYLHSAPVSCEEFAGLLQHGKGWLMLPAETPAAAEVWRQESSIRVNAI